MKKLKGAELAKFNQDHPAESIPGEGNRFVKKGGGEKPREERNAESAVAGAKSAQNLVRQHEENIGESVEQQITRKAKEHVPPALGFANKERRETAHHREHAREMGFKTQKEYERAGCNFFNSNRGKMYYSIKRKRFYRYDEKTGELAVSSNGVLHTYMRVNEKLFAKRRKEEQLYE